MRWVNPRSVRSGLLKLSIHFEAFARSPFRYVAASWWWLLGKRVRARARLAPLLARSSCAYDAWVLRENRPQGKVRPEGPPLIALVSNSGGGDLDATMTSIASDGIDAYLIEANPGVDLLRIADVIDWAADPWFLPVTAGDILATGAVDAYREAMQKCSTRVIYGDDDLLNHRGRRIAPHFKPDWNSELFRNHDYLTGSCVVRADRKAFAAAAAAADWAGALVASAVTNEGALHIRRVLHHRLARRLPVTQVPALEVAAHLPRISIIIPTRNRMDLLANCMAGVDAVDYPDVEIIIVDNDSDDPGTIALLEQFQKGGTKVLRHHGPFNYSTINNRAVSEATGELICLLNNDIEMFTTSWLSIMATQALREDVGAVGAQLLYPDGRIQHAGVVIGVGGAAGHAHRFLRPEAEGHFHRHLLPQFVSAVTAACMVVRRDRFLAVGGLDATNFPVAFNDVDLCLRLNERGWQSLYEPRATLVHHESVSRGSDSTLQNAARFSRELAALQRRWLTHQVVDSFHHPHLSRASEQFVLAV